MQGEYVRNHNLSHRPLEERKMIARKSAEVRARKKYEKMALQKCMSTLLSNRVVGKEERKVLASVGFDDKAVQDNGALLMTVLFKKGLSGDVTAIREIVGMMEKLEYFQETGSLQNDVTINLVSVGDDFRVSEEQKKEIEQAQEESFMQDDDLEEWGNDIFNG